MKQQIAIIDYGMGNLRSVSKALEHVAPDSHILVTSDKQQIHDADRVIFPGVGAISHCMQELAMRDLLSSVRQAAHDKPFFGICLGMQALLETAHENDGVSCFGLIKGEVPKFPDSLLEQGMNIPHMGWSQVSQIGEHALWHGIKDNSRFYFVHSYYVKPENESVISGSCNYGIDFSATIARDNIFATQFHPEKSQHDGLQLLKNFSTWNGTC